MELLLEFKNCNSCKLPTIHETGYQHTIIKLPGLPALFKKNKLTMFVARLGIEAITDTKLNVADILYAVENNKLDDPPLQSDTIYCYCKLKKSKADLDILTKLNSATANRKSITVLIDNMTGFEVDYIPLDIPVYKDIIFNYMDKEIGFYNMKANILWLCDIGHYKDKFKDKLYSILTTISYYKLRGEIPILPNLTIGIDPEFEIFDGKTFIRADTIIQDDPHNNPKEIGHDGHPQIGELRPHFARNPIALSRNIKRSVKKLLRYMATVNNNYRIYIGGGISDHLGGHIHFNMNLPNDPTKLRHILHDLVGIHMRRSMSDKSVRKNGREAQKYMDKNGEEVFRHTESHKPGFEWRMPPSFILNDDICKAVLCTVWCVIKEYYGKGFTKTTYDQPDEVIDKLKSLQLYSYYSRWIDKFIELFILNKTSMEEKDLKKHWNIAIPEYNITIKSNINWIKQYFVPVRMPLVKNIQIRIDTVGGENRLTVYTHFNLPQEIHTIINDFAIKYMVRATIEKYTDMIEDLILYMPWVDPQDTKVAFSQLKEIIKLIINEINKQNIEASKQVEF